MFWLLSVLALWPSLNRNPKGSQVKLRGKGYGFTTRQRWCTIRTTTLDILPPLGQRRKYFDTKFRLPSMICSVMSLMRPLPNSTPLTGLSCIFPLVWFRYPSPFRRNFFFLIGHWNSNWSSIRTGQHKTPTLRPKLCPFKPYPLWCTLHRTPFSLHPAQLPVTFRVYWHYDSYSPLQPSLRRPLHPSPVYRNLTDFRFRSVTS